MPPPWCDLNNGINKPCSVNQHKPFLFRVIYLSYFVIVNRKLINQEVGSTLMLNLCTISDLDCSLIPKLPAHMLHRSNLGFMWVPQQQEQGLFMSLTSAFHVNPVPCLASLGEGVPSFETTWWGWGGLKGVTPRRVQPVLKGEGEGGMGEDLHEQALEERKDWYWVLCE